MNISKCKILVVLIGILAIQPAIAQISRFSKNTYVNDKSDTLRYRMLYPDANPSRKYPLVIFLHGSGERGNDNEAQLKWGIENLASDEMMSRYPAFVIAPQCPKDQSWSNLDFDRNAITMALKPEASKPMKLVIELIKQFIATQPIDTNRIYITGLSMGGMGTFDILERQPELFAAAVPVCGGGDISKAESIANIPIWIFHGAEDPAVNTEFSYKMADALKAAGAHPGLTIYPETGHFSWLAAYSDPLMWAWLFRQSK